MKYNKAMIVLYQLMYKIYTLVNRVSCLMTDYLLLGAIRAKYWYEITKHGNETSLQNTYPETMSLTDNADSSLQWFIGHFFFLLLSWHHALEACIYAWETETRGFHIGADDVRFSHWCWRREVFHIAGQSTLLSPRHSVGQPLLGSSSQSSRPSRNRPYHRRTFKQDNAWSP
jgi:hypothetical protein